MFSAREKLTANIVDLYLAGKKEESLLILSEILLAKYCFDNKIIFYEVFRTYFESNLQRNSDLLEITLKLLSVRCQRVKNYQLNELLTTHFSAFNVDQLEEILESLGEENLDRSPLNNPVLLSILSGDQFKLQFYLEHNYVIPEQYKTTHVSYYLCDQGDRSFHYEAYAAIPEYEGANLKDVLVGWYPNLYFSQANNRRSVLSGS